MNRILLMLIALVGFTFAACKDDEVIKPEELPSAIQTFVKTHFPSHTVLRAEKDKNDNTRYEVDLSENVKLDFNSNNEVIDMEAPKGLPESVFQAPVWTYVKTEYPNRNIVEWEKNATNQKLEIDNGLELLFTLDGEFLNTTN